MNPSSPHKRKWAAVRALGATPDFSWLEGVAQCSDREIGVWLQWLDHSGLALYLFERLRSHGELKSLPVEVRKALATRLASNRQRMDKMLADFGAVSSALQTGGISHAFAKGFTLFPDFCPNIWLRHQSDLDVLISSQSLPQATEALTGIGYARRLGREPKEIVFAAPGRSIHSSRDDAYQMPPQREVELQTTIWRETGGVTMHVPMNWQANVRTREIHDVTFAALSLEDAFLLQILHAFSHFLGSWLRVSWLWEIHYFAGLNEKNPALWRAIQNRAGDDPMVRNAFGLVLGLTRLLFQTKIPPHMEAWCLDHLPGDIHEWIRQYGAQWTLSDISGSKLSLFIHRGFFDRSENWNAYLFRRIAPIIGRPSPVRLEASDWKIRLKAYWEQIRVASQRGAFHAGALLELTLEAYRWRHLVRTARKHATASE